MIKYTQLQQVSLKTKIESTLHNFQKKKKTKLILFNESYILKLLWIVQEEEFCISSGGKKL